VLRSGLRYAFSDVKFDWPGSIIYGRITMRILLKTTLIGQP
jgi:hypothetical protein